MKPARKTRAQQACLSCNARRVKCNVVNSRPCTNCEALDIPCELRESRRGKHPRRSNLSQPSKRPHVQLEHEDPAFVDSRDAEASIHSEDTSPSAAGRLHTYPASQATFGDCFGPLPAPIHMSPGFVSQESLVIHDPLESNDAELDDHLSASRALAGLSQHENPQPCAIIRPPEQKSPLGEILTRSPLNEPRSGQGHVRQEDEVTIFLGESTSLTYLHGTHTSPSTLATPDQGFVYRIPEAVRAQNSTLEWEIERKQARLKLLHAEGAFSFPAKTATDSLFKAYFEWFHVCFPVLDEPDIWQQYSQGTLPPLLFQAILFIGVMHCAEDELPSVGLGCRQRAKYTLYNRAKDLFDAEIEPKSITVIQSVLLMSFWRAGALLQKDTRHWLAVAVSLAQTKGLYRSSQNTNGKDTNFKLRKRLWWSIYIRERQCAAALGLPNRVREETRTMTSKLSMSKTSSMPLSPRHHLLT